MIQIAFWCKKWMSKIRWKSKFKRILNMYLWYKFLSEAILSSIRVYGSFLRYSDSYCFRWHRYSKYSSKYFLCSAGLSWIMFERKFVQGFKRAYFIKHLYMQRTKFDGFSEFSTGGHSRSLQFWYESTGNFTRNLSMIL